MDTIEISNGFQKIYFHKSYLRKQGLDFIKKKYGKSYYTKKVTEIQKKELIKYCKKHLLHYTIIEDKYSRSSNYRKIYLDTLQNKKYVFCAYCGFLFKPNKITVDHIIPIHKAKNNRGCARLLLKLFRINNVNSIKNLAPACSRCNSKKSSKMGLWILKGFIGKYNILWVMRWSIRFVFIISMIYYIQYIYA